MAKIVFHPNRCMGCNSCQVACAVEHSKTKKLQMSINEVPHPVPRLRLQLKGKISIIMCKHCENAPCVSSCPFKALKRDHEFGQIVIDHALCRACGICAKKCPEKAITIFSSTVHICDGCIARQQMNSFPACVSACPTGAITLENR